MIEAKPKPDRRIVAALVDETERQRLVQLARREDRSVSAIIRRALRAELDRSAGER